MACGGISVWADQWQTQPQPELKEAMAQAPNLVVENVSQPTRTTRLEGTRLVPNADGTADILVTYYKGYQGPGTLFSIDTNSGEVVRSDVPRGRNCHMQGSAFGSNGKMFQTFQVVGTGLELWVYDPETNRLEAKGMFGKELQIMGQGNRLVSGHDGYIYGSLLSKKSGNATFYQINTHSSEVEIWESDVRVKGSPYMTAIQQGPGGNLYACYGKTPNRLIEFDPRTGKGRSLATANPQGKIQLLDANPDTLKFSVSHAESGVAGDGVFQLGKDGSIVRVGGLSEVSSLVKKGGGTKIYPQTKPAKDSGAKPGKKQRFTELIQSGMTPAEAKRAILGDLSSSSNRPTNKKSKIGTVSTMPSFKGLQVDRGRLDPAKTLDGKGLLRYRVNSDSEWQTVELDPPLYSEALVQVSTLPDGRIFGTATNRAGHFIHNPVSDKTTFLGRTGLQHHSSAISGNRIYFSGYPSSLLWSYDFSGADWKEPILAKIGQGQIGKSSKTDNPRKIGVLREHSGVHMATCAATDSEGTVYFAGRWYRDGNGGGVGWWDPANEKSGGFWEALSNKQVTACCDTGEGRYIVLSTKVVADKVLAKELPKSASLCIIDSSTNRDEIAFEIIPVPGASSTGLIAYAGENRIIGICPSLEGEHIWILYGVDLASRKVAFRKQIPGLPAGKVRSDELLHSYRNSLITALMVASGCDIWDVS